MSISTPPSPPAEIPTPPMAGKVTLSGEVTGPIDDTKVSKLGQLTVQQILTAVDSINAMQQDTSAAEDSNVPNSIIRRDAGGNFSAGVITATLQGNAASATFAMTADKASSAGSAGFALGKLGFHFPGQTAGALTLDLSTGNYFNIAEGLTPPVGPDAAPAITTFATNVTAGSSGARITLLFTKALKLVHGAPNVTHRLLLKGRGSFITSPNDIFEFLFNGFDWVEVSRSVSKDSEVFVTCTKSTDGSLGHCKRSRIPKDLGPLHKLDQNGNVILQDNHVILDEERPDTDYQQEYDPSTGIFTARQDGLYQINALLTLEQKVWPLSLVYPILMPLEVAGTSFQPPADAFITGRVSLSFVKFLQAGQLFYLQLVQSSGSDVHLEVGSYLSISRLK